MSEYLAIAVLTVTGWVLVRAAGLSGWGALPLGYLVGVFTTVAIGLVLLVAGASTAPLALIVAVAAVGAVAFAVGRERFARRDVALLAWTLVALAALVGAFRELHLVSYHIDSFRYLLGGALLAQNLAIEVGDPGLWTKRMLVAPVLHALAHGHGEVYLRSVTPLFALATLGAVVWFVRAGSHAAAGRAWGWVVALTAAGLLVSINRFVWHAFYVNSHLFTGGAFLVLAASGWLLATRSEREGRGLLLLAVLAVPTVVVGRPEGFVMAALALVPMLTAERIAPRSRSLLLVAYGLATAGWHAQILRTFDGAAPLAVVGPLAVGVAAILVAPLAGWPLLTRRAGSVRLAVLVGLVGLLAALAVRDPDLLRRSLSATYANVVLGEGSWGPAIVMLVLLVGVTMALHRGVALAALRFPLLASIPMLFVFAYLRDGAYRVGDGDSLNRMLIQFVPLAVLYLAAVSAGPWRLAGRRRAPDRPAEGGA